MPGRDRRSSRTSAYPPKTLPIFGLTFSMPPASRQVDVLGYGTAVGDLEHDGPPPIARLALGAVLDHVDLERAS